MLLNVFALVLSFIDLPLSSISIDNNGSSYDLTYHELTLYTNIETYNSIYETTDNFTKNTIINLSDYIVWENLGRLDIIVECGYFSVVGDNFEMSINYTINILDLNYGYWDSVYFVEGFNEILAEPYIEYFGNDTNLYQFSYTLYDFKNDYQTGFTAGKEEGIEIGYDEGYEDGKLDGLEQGRLEGQGVNNVITWFGSIWDALSNFLSLEIAPNLTIGTIITIPIVIAVLFFGLKALIQ